HIVTDQHGCHGRLGTRLRVGIRLVEDFLSTRRPDLDLTHYGKCEFLSQAPGNGCKSRVWLNQSSLLHHFLASAFKPRRPASVARLERDHPSWIISSCGFESSWYPFDVTRTSCSRLHVPSFLVTDGSMVKTISFCTGFSPCLPYLLGHLGPRSGPIS